MNKTRPIRISEDIISLIESLKLDSQTVSDFLSTRIRPPRERVSITESDFKARFHLTDGEYGVVRKYALDYGGFFIGKEVWEYSSVNKRWYL